MVVTHFGLLRSPAGIVILQSSSRASPYQGNWLGLSVTGLAGLFHGQHGTASWATFRYSQPSLRDWVICQSIKQKRLLGFARRFRPTYAWANVGHPSLSSCLFASRRLFLAPALKRIIGIEVFHRSAEALLPPHECGGSHHFILTHLRAGPGRLHCNRCPRS